MSWFLPLARSSFVVDRLRRMLPGWPIASLGWQLTALSAPISSALDLTSLPSTDTAAMLYATAQNRRMGIIANAVGN